MITDTQVSLIAAILIALISAVPATIAALAAWNQSKKTHILFNSRMSEMLALTKQAAGDAATLAEKKAEHVRQGEAALADEQPTNKNKLKGN